MIVAPTSNFFLPQKSKDMKQQLAGPEKTEYQKTNTDWGLLASAPQKGNLRQWYWRHAAVKEALQLGIQEAREELLVQTWGAFIPVLLGQLHLKVICQSQKDTACGMEDLPVSKIPRFLVALAHPVPVHLSSFPQSTQPDTETQKPMQRTRNILTITNKIYYTYIYIHTHCDMLIIAYGVFEKIRAT
jgi:hypothetical protein